jgi:hypothetical protein
VNLWHSKDHGATWERQRDPGPQDKNGTWCSCDTDVDLGPDGMLYITDFWVTDPAADALADVPPAAPVVERSPGQNGFVVESSRDGGATWGQGNFVTQIQPSSNDRQYIIAGTEPGEVYLAYAAGEPHQLGSLSPVPLPPFDAPSSAPSGGLQLWRSTDGGQTFSFVSKPSEDGFIARPRVASDGSVFYGWGALPSGATDPWNTTTTYVIARSADKGQTWQPVEIGRAANGTGGLWPMELDVGPDGMVHAVWMERMAQGSLLYYARSADGGATYGAPRLVTWANGTAFLPWVAHAGPGRAVVAFYGSPDEVEPLKAPESTRWDAWALVVDATTASPPVRVSASPVKVGVFCPQGAACPHDRELLDYPSVTWRDGWVHVAFAVSTLDEGVGHVDGSGSREPRGGHSTNAYVWHARARLS